MNQMSCIYRLDFLMGLSLKTGIFHLKVAKSSYFPNSACLRRACYTPYAPRCIFSLPGVLETIFGAHHGTCPQGASVDFLARNRVFLRHLGVFFHITCFGTWNRIYPSCNFFKGLLNLHSLSSQIILCFQDALLW
jgi:hypothetical protein